jgi:hypothetical protein
MSFSACANVVREPRSRSYILLSFLLLTDLDLRSRTTLLLNCYTVLELLYLFG